MTTNDKFKVKTGNCEKLGSYRSRRGVNFALNIFDGIDAELRIYTPGTDEPMQIISFTEEYRIGFVNAIKVEIPEKTKFEYNYRIDGEIVPDPFAKCVRTHVKADGKSEIRCSLLPKVVVKTMPLQTAFGDSVFYKLHVKGFTMGMIPPVKNPGTFDALKNRLGYLIDLGITSVILMPIHEFDEVPKKKKTKNISVKGEYRKLEDIIGTGIESEKNTEKREEKKEKRNYWGYAEGLFFVPKRSYCATDDPAKEFASLVDAMHKKGLEVILEFYFPEHMPGWKVVQILRFWRFTYHVDGFHIVGNGPWINAVTDDMTLSGTKLLYEYIDQGRVYEKKSPYYRNLCVMNKDYEFTMRRFLKGDEGVEDSAKWFIRNTSESIAGVNYFADNDGFTMMDMVSYETRHNEANGQDNTDGMEMNFTWNGGVEGPTKKRKILKFRQKQLRNAFAMLMTSQSTPMIYGGDECCNSQEGNNNAWCQDNEVGWQTWKKTKDAKVLHRFVKNMIAFRMKHPILRMRNPMRLMDYKAYGYPDISYHGSKAWYMDEVNMKNAFGILYCGNYASSQYGYADDFVYIAYNMFWEKQAFALPDLPAGLTWNVAVDTEIENSFQIPDEDQAAYFKNRKQVTVASRSIVILTSRPYKPGEAPEVVDVEVDLDKYVAEMEAEEAKVTDPIEIQDAEDKVIIEAYVEADA